MLYVQCCCSSGAAAAAGRKHSCSSQAEPQIFGLEEWVEGHAKGPKIPEGDGDDQAVADEAEAVVRGSLQAGLGDWDPKVRSRRD